MQSGILAYFVQALLYYTLLYSTLLRIIPSFPNTKQNATQNKFPEFPSEKRMQNGRNAPMYLVLTAIGSHVI